MAIALALLRTILTASLTTLGLGAIDVSPLASASCPVPQLRWVTAWAAPPQASSSTLAAAGDPVIPTFDYSTVRMVITPNAAGSEVRIRLSNRFGSTPVTFSAARVARSAGGAAVVTNTARQLHFGGRTSLTIPARGHTISDAVPFDVNAGVPLAVSFHVAGRSSLDAHVWGMQTSYVTDAMSADQTNDGGGAFRTETTARYAVTGLDVRSRSTGGVVVAIGDSITDGVGSSVDADRRWTDLLAAKFASSGTRLTVVNAGIAGAQVAGSSARVGRSTPDRIAMDAMTLSGVTHVVIAGGINDLWYGGHVDPVAAMTDAYRRAAEKARSAGLVVIGATIPPAGQSGGVEWYRVMVNNWIKQTPVYDAVIDFDAALRDPAATNTMRSGVTDEVVHPNDVGYEAMASVAMPSLAASDCR